MNAYRVVPGILALGVGFAWISLNHGTASAGSGSTAPDLRAKDPPPADTDCAADVIRDGVIDVGDLVEVVLSWGP